LPLTELSPAHAALAERMSDAIARIEGEPARIGNAS
jgi:hypothetical protein